MSEERNEVHIKTYDEWLKYYKNATKEQVIEDLTRDVQYFADAVKDIKDLQQKLEQLENIRKIAIAFVKNNKDKTIAPYGDDEDTDYEVCLFEDDINDLLGILNKEVNKE